MIISLFEKSPIPHRLCFGFTSFTVISTNNCPFLGCGPVKFPQHCFLSSQPSYYLTQMASSTDLPERNQVEGDRQNQRC